MELVVHIGLQKTGTTYLQRVLSTHDQELAKFGLTYPKPGLALPNGGGMAHHFMAHAFLRQRYSYTPDGSFDRLVNHMRAIKRATSAPDGVGVLSSEDISRFAARHIAEFHEHLRERRVRILVYLRRQDLWLDSLYGQMLKVGRNTSIERFAANQRKRMNYRKFLEPWAHHFGKENIIVRPYEGFETGGLWDDFCRALDMRDAAQMPLRIASANVSLSPEASRFLASIRNPDLRRSLRPILEAGECNRPRVQRLSYLSPELAATLLDTYRSSNRRVAQTYLGRDDLFEDMRPAQAQPTRGAMLRYGVVARSLALGTWRRWREDNPDAPQKR